jgi:phosphopantothenoylcysteine synthetase/decarboxylase
MKIVKNKEWDILHENYPQEINFTRDDLKEFLIDHRDEDLTDQEWYEFREKIMDQITNELQEL